MTGGRGRYMGWRSCSRIRIESGRKHRKHHEEHGDGEKHPPELAEQSDLRLGGLDLRADEHRVGPQDQEQTDNSGDRASNNDMMRSSLQVSGRSSASSRTADPVVVDQDPTVMLDESGHQRRGQLARTRSVPDVEDEDRCRKGTELVCQPAKPTPAQAGARWGQYGREDRGVPSRRHDPVLNSELAR